MVIAVDPNRSLSFIFPNERKLAPELQTVFRFRPLDPSESRDLIGAASAAATGAEGVFLAAQVQVDLAIASLTGWDNFKKDGVAVPFVAEWQAIRGRRVHAATQETLSFLTWEQLAVLASGVREINSLTETDAKN